MNKEDKQLLLKDLCARLPYDIKIDYEGRIYYLNEINPACKHIDYISVFIQDEERLQCAEHILIEDIKPYLRPMSSMTEEEMEEYNDTWELDRKDILTIGEELESDYKHKGYESIWEHPVVPLYRHIDWLNSHHFDYMGLIEKGLALEAPEGMYNLA